MRPYFWPLLCLTPSACSLIASSDELQSGKQAATGDCVLNSDCEAGNVCIFRVCSKPCETNRDCAADQDCLVTSEGAACVSQTNNACSEGGDCPAGTRCDDTMCKTVCGAEKKLACLMEQSCIDGLCETNASTIDGGNGGSSSDANGAATGPGDAGNPADGASARDAATDGGVSDPCADHCDPRVTCQVVDARAVCGECPKGFRDVRDDGTQCEDIDECSGPTPLACDIHANCMNTPGSAYCECESGYNGTGLVCLKNVACPNGNECGANATCSTLSGEKFCVCNGGFSGDGGACVDINECTLNSDGCDDLPDACVNDLGGVHCKCPSGYDGAGSGVNGCADLDECAINSDTCDDSPNACVNDEGAFHCDCPNGYDGSGAGSSGCIDIDECSDNTDGCDDSPEACVNSVGTFSCDCPDGYSGMGMGSGGCADIDECMLNTDGCDDAPNACRNSVGGFSCACPNGYMGSGTGSNGCMDINECASNNGSCDANASCTNLPGSSSCTCNCGYSGPGTSCSQTSLYFGNGPSSGFTGTLSTASGYAYGYKINLSSAARLLNYGIISRSAGPKVRFALYTDAAGVPGSLIAQSPMAGKVTSVGIVLALSADACTALTAGDYWLFMTPDQALDIASASSGSATFRYVAFNFASAFPANLTGTISSTGAPFASFFVVD